MDTPKQLFLQLEANISAYEITIYDGERQLRQAIYHQKTCLCLWAYTSCLRIVLRPLINGYSAKLYYYINTDCKNFFALRFSFPQNATPSGAVNTFTLTDRNYGLPIDGRLLFTQA